MKLRTILYGYEMKNGYMEVIESEATVVRNIFSLYIEGKSLKEIAESLTEQGIVYYLEKNKWNKNMVSRIIDNLNYVGNDDYPSIISSSDFELATIRKNKMGGTRVELSSVTSLIKSKTVCSQCGKKLRRINKWSSREKWICPNSCKIDAYFGDKEIFDGTLDVINQVIQSPELLAVDTTSEKYEPTLEIIRQEKEIERMMEQSKIEFCVISNLVLKCASQKYECCSFDKSSALTDELMDKFEDLPMLRKLENYLLETTIEQITINREGSLIVEFINGAEIVSQYNKEE